MVLAFVAIAFATAIHARTAPGVGDERLAACLLADGSIEDLCRHGEGDHDHTAECPLCHPVSAPDLPEIARPPVGIGYILSPFASRSPGKSRHARDPATPLRGPPMILGIRPEERVPA